MQAIHGPEASLIAATSGGLLIAFFLVAFFSYLLGRNDALRIERRRRKQAARDTAALRR